MAYSKIKKILFVLLCLFVVLFPFWCVRGLCAEEGVELTQVEGLRATSNSNYFTTDGSVSQFYCQLEKGYIYTVYNDSSTANTSFVFCNEIPSVNVTYYDYTVVSPGNTYTFIVDDNYQYLIFSGNNFDNPSRYLTRQKIASMDGAVEDLVDNVGIQSLWNIFNSANSFLAVVVLFSFGLFIIIALVRKLRKGKGGF